LAERLHEFDYDIFCVTSFNQVIGIVSVSLLPVETVADLTPTFFMGLLKVNFGQVEMNLHTSTKLTFLFSYCQALVPSILMNIYIVGLNQLFDVEIDKVNHYIL